MVKDIVCEVIRTLLINPVYEPLFPANSLEFNNHKHENNRRIKHTMLLMTVLTKIHNQVLILTKELATPLLPYGECQERESPWHPYVGQSAT